MFIWNIRQVNEMHLQSAKLYSSEQLVPLSTHASICYQAMIDDVSQVNILFPFMFICSLKHMQGDRVIVVFSVQLNLYFS